MRPLFQNSIFFGFYPLTRLRPCLSSRAASGTGGAGKSAGGPALRLADGVSSLADVLRESTGAGARFTGAESSGTEARDWWKKRFAQDQRLETLLADADASWLGPWRSLLMGAPEEEGAAAGATAAPGPPEWGAAGLEGLSAEYLEVLRLLSAAAAAGLVSADEAAEAVAGCGLAGAAAEAATTAVLQTPSPAAAAPQPPPPLPVRGGGKRGAAKAASEAAPAGPDSAAPQPAAGLQSRPQKRGPVLLMLDWDLQDIPWESFPSLLGESVYRVPSLAAAAASLAAAAASNSTPAAERAPVPRAVDLERTWYVLNPSGDLPSTQKTFQGWFSGNPGWEGVSGRVPNPAEHLAALSTHDLFVYFGHGGGQQYAPSSSLRRLGRCAAGLLMGCSSGAAGRRGEYPPTLPAMGYILAGSPAAVANLWDVTDKDIDRFSSALLRSWLGAGAGADEDGAGISINNSSGGAAGRASPGTRADMLRGLAEARAATKLPSLTGAAPVCYGLPTAVLVPPWGNLAAAAADAAAAAGVSAAAAQPKGDAAGGEGARKKGGRAVASRGKPAGESGMDEGGSPSDDVEGSSSVSSSAAPAQEEAMKSSGAPAMKKTGTRGAGCK